MSDKMRPDIVAIGASAGGIEAICSLIGELPTDLPAPVLITLHRSRYLTSNFPAVISRCTRMSVRVATDGSLLEHGVCPICPPEWDRSREICRRVGAMES